MSCCYLQKESLKVLLKIMGSTMGPSSLYWCYNTGSQTFDLSMVIYCCKEVHRFVAEKLLLYTAICCIKYTPWLHLSLDSEHPVTGHMVFPSCMVLSFSALKVWGPFVHNSDISMFPTPYTFHSKRGDFLPSIPHHHHHPYSNFLVANC